jgi:TRAP-type mannitol/chloroaromatic compound transport system substrate-binding protein
MRRKNWLHIAALAGVAGWVVAGTGAADAQERVKWKLASSYTSTLDVIGKNILRLIDNIKIMSDGNFDIQFNEPGALVPALEVFDAVSKGSVQASYTTTGFHAGRVPHMIFFSSVPFGPNVNEYVAWIQHGGGYELYAKGYGEHNIKGFQCGIVVAESSGWFKEPIESLDDLKGLKMRFFGLGAKVMGKLGVSVIPPPPGVASVELSPQLAAELNRRHKKIVWKDSPQYPQPPPFPTQGILTNRY